MESLNHMINLHKNKAEEKCLKKQNKETIHEDEDDIEERERLVENWSPFYPQEERWERVLCVKKKQEKRPKVKESKDPLRPLAIVISPSA